MPMTPSARPANNPARTGVDAPDRAEEGPEGRTGAGTEPVPLYDLDAAIFDLDGVVTRTASVHAASWKRLFDEYLQARSKATGEPFVPFDTNTDYPRYVDGKPRPDGIESFLRSRRISLPRGEPSDPPDSETVWGLGNRKNRYFHKALEDDGVEIFGTTAKLIADLSQRGIATALVSSSRNARAVLDRAALTDRFDVIVDGTDLARLKLKGKPAPDLFLKAAELLGVAPQHAAVFEDAISGVEAGRAGGFGLVVGLDRQNQTDELARAGADVVVRDVADLKLSAASKSEAGAARPVPSALERFDDIRKRMAGRKVAVFLDYDGTLTPIVARPDLAILAHDMRGIVSHLATLCTVAVVSGRDLGDVRRLVGLDGLVYAGSHGFDIAGPGGLRIRHQNGAAYEAAVQRAAERLEPAVAGIEGALVEPKRFAVAVHYRQVEPDQVPAVEAAVDAVLDEVSELRKTHGKKVFELRPRFDWDKGKAVDWLLEALGLNGPEVLPFYLGDDTTDEDAFRALRQKGIGILVGPDTSRTAAHYVLASPEEVGRFLTRLGQDVEGSAGG